LPAQIKANIEQTTRVAAWSAVQDRLLLVQRWQGTKIAELNLPNKTPANCAKRWTRFHAKVLDTTMVNLPEHASSDFVAELSDLMSDHAWWDAVEAKRVELLNDRAGRDRSVAAEGDRAPTAEETPAPCTARSERNEIKAIGEHHSELLVLAARLLRVRLTRAGRIRRSVRFTPLKGRLPLKVTSVEPGGFQLRLLALEAE